MFTLCYSCTDENGRLNQLEAFEFWAYRGMLRLSSRVTNENILRRMHEDRGLLVKIKRRQTTYLGRTIRKEN